MGCTPDAVVCDDTGTSYDPALLVVQAAVGAVVVVALLLVVVLVLRRRARRTSRPPVTRVWIDAAGDVVRRS